MKKSLSILTKSVFLLFVMGFLLASCAKEDVLEKGIAPELAAATKTTYGSCATCPLPTTVAGPLSGLLISNNDFLNALRGCYEQDLPKGCQFRRGTSSVDITGVQYVQFAQLVSNTQINHCSYFYQLGNAALSSQPGSGNWLLTDIISVQYGSWGNNNFQIKTRWRKYICEAISLRN